GAADVRGSFQPARMRGRDLRLAVPGPQQEPEPPLVRHEDLRQPVEGPPPLSAPPPPLRRPPLHTMFTPITRIGVLTAPPAPTQKREGLQPAEVAVAQPPCDDESPGRGVSRRTFLKTAGVGAAATSLIGGEVQGAPAEVLGPDAVPLSLKVNGALKSVTVEPRVTLLRALRNHLDLTGAKEVCDRGSCGGCTRPLPGDPARSSLSI